MMVVTRYHKSTGRAFNFVRGERTNMAERAANMHQYLAVKYGNTTGHIEIRSTVDSQESPNEMELFRWLTW
jgi:hypothetical protein